MAQTLAELELNWDRDHRTLQTLQAQVAALAADNFGLRARVLTLEQDASTHTTATVEQLTRIADYQRAQANHYLGLQTKATLP